MEFLILVAGVISLAWGAVILLRQAGCWEARWSCC